MKEKAFSNPRENSVYLKFANGNSLSTIWGYGSYSENHDKGDFSTKNEGSDNCEIYPMCDEKTLKKIKKVLPDLDTVAGYVSMEDWLKVVNILSN